MFETCLLFFKFEERQSWSSEDFYDRCPKGLVDDNLDFVEWANDYQHFLALKSELEACLSNVA